MTTTFDALRELGGQAAGPSPTTGHVKDPLLALIRAGDQGDDIIDAIAHIARCPECRARFTEGEAERKTVVVVAIEAPRRNLPEVTKAAEEIDARLIERGEGRWTAVVDAEKSNAFASKLDKGPGEASVVTRLAAALPMDMPIESRTAHPRWDIESGLSAAEVQAWAQVSRTPKRRAATPRPSVGWALFALFAIGGAIAFAYWLALH